MARDRRVPGAPYLEGDAALELLAVATEHAGARLVGARLRSVHDRPGRSLSHVYEATLEHDGTPREVLLIAHADRRPLPEGAFALRRGDAEVAVWRFPHDPYLPGLPSAIDTARVRELLDGLEAPAGAVTVHTRAYRPSRRAVVEVTIATPDQVGRILYLKLLAGDRAEELADVHRQLRPHVPVPRVIGVSPGQGLLAMEALEGRTLRAALVDGSPLPAPDEVVALTQRFARSGLRSRRDPRAFADPSRHVAALVEAVPDRRPAIERVAAAAVAIEGPLVPVHGDLHDGQLLLDGERIVGLLDVDGSGTGHLAADVGNLVAHVEVVGELWPQVADRCAALADALRDAFRPQVGAADLARGTAGAWLGLATGPRMAQDEDWRTATGDRIDRAVAALDAG